MSWGGENDRTEESPNACCTKTTSAEIGKRRMAAKHTDRRDRREREVVVGEEVGFATVLGFGLSVLHF